MSRHVPATKLHKLAALSPLTAAGLSLGCSGYIHAAWLKHSQARAAVAADQARICIRIPWEPHIFLVWPAFCGIYSRYSLTSFAPVTMKSVCQMPRHTRGTMPLNRPPMPCSFMICTRSRVPLSPCSGRHDRHPPEREPQADPHTRTAHRSHVHHCSHVHHRSHVHHGTHENPTQQMQLIRQFAAQPHWKDPQAAAKPPRTGNPQALTRRIPKPLHGEYPSPGTKPWHTVQCSDTF